MSHVPRWISDLAFNKRAHWLVWAATGLMVGGCATASDQLAKRLKPGEAVSQVYFAKYEEVETALKIAMLKYPQKVDNTEAGIFETDYVKGESRFKAPYQTSDLPTGYRYRLIVRLVKGKTQSRPAVNVSILKQIELARDFFASPNTGRSDGLEERVILYRIGRQLTIMKSLKKALEKSTKQDLPPEL